MRSEKTKLVRSDAQDVAIFVQGILNRPRVSAREPRERVRFGEGSSILGHVTYQ